MKACVKLLSFIKYFFFCSLMQAMFQLGTMLVSLPMGGLYPAVGLHSIGEEVRLFLGLNWVPEEDSLMSVDTNEEEWYRLNDIRLNGQVCFGLL
jgi:hypothetical protein